MIHLRTCLGIVALAVVVSRAQAEEKLPAYPNHQDLTYYLDSAGKKQPIKTVADWEQRRRHILLGLQAAMGPLPGNDKRSPLDVKVVEEVKVGQLVRRKLTFQSEMGNRVPAYLLMPAPDGKKRPAILVLQQTTKMGKNEPVGLAGRENMHVALHLAQRGFVTLCPDYPSFGEYAYDFKTKKDYASGTMKAIWDNIRAVDLLQSLPEVDPERIGGIGHSLGGHNTMFTGAFEPRLKALVSSCGYCRFHKDDVPSWTGLVYMPRIASIYKNSADLMPFDFPEIIGTFAPRPFMTVAAVKDDDFDVVGVKESVEMARPVYALFGKPDNLQEFYPEGKHDFPPEARKKAYEFLEKHLGK